MAVDRCIYIFSEAPQKFIHKDRQQDHQILSGGHFGQSERQKHMLFPFFHTDPETDDHKGQVQELGNDRGISGSPGAHRRKSTFAKDQYIIQPRIADNCCKTGIQRD